MESKKTVSIKNIILVFLPVFAAVILQYAVMFGDVMILFLKNLCSDDRSVNSHTAGMIMNQSYAQPMNRAYMSLAQYLLFILCFGLWYYKAFCKNSIKDGESLKAAISSSFRALFAKLPPVCLIICGYALQVFVDSILALLHPVFPETMNAYDQMISGVTGVSSSWVMLLSVILFGPIGEELLFRGLILRYGNRLFPYSVSILLQACLFGVYHGNIVQGIYAFAIGIIFGALACRYDSIIPGILLHIIINASILFIPEVFLSNTIHCIITAAISAVIAAVILVLFFIRHQDKTADSKD